MRNSYAVLAADPNDDAACKTLLHVSGTLGNESRAWRLETLERATAIFVGANASLRPPHPTTAALVIGTAFHRRSGERVSSFEALGESPHQQSRRMAADLFGRYVAVFPPTSRRPMCVFRDPSGAREALMWRSLGLTVVASHLEPSLSRATGFKSAIDWEQIALYASDPLALGIGCGLQGVRSVDAGCLAGWDAHGEFRSVPVWRPQDWLKPNGLRRDQALTALRDAADMSVKSAFESPALVEVSGGLDSSIVAEAARRQNEPGASRWINYFGETEEADERGFARDVAQAIGIQLIERPKTDFVFHPEDLIAVMAGPRPSLNVLDVQYDRDLAHQAEQLGAKVLLTGQGGDGVFFQSRTEAIAADVLMTAGLWPHAPGLLMSLARWTQQSLWSILGAACGGVLRPRPLRAVKRERHWSHPWLEFPARTPPGKRIHVENLLAAQVFNGACARADAAELVHPLLTQPVVELCLGLPTPVLTEGRRDRALARAAFQDRLPASVIERKSKGDLTAYYGRLIAASLPSLRPFMLNGALADRGLLDRSLLEERLSYDDLLWRGDYAGILQLVATEAWVRRWAALN